MTATIAKEMNSKRILRLKSYRFPQCAMAVTSSVVLVKILMKSHQNVQKHADHQITKIGNTVEIYSVKISSQIQ
jgi:hypothetical protein